MKEPLSLERGRIAVSTQGRDKGHAFLILDRVGEDAVMVADGLVHPLERPKKKKIKHLHVKPIMVNWNAVRPEGGTVQDSDLRRALEKNGFTVKRSLCKEG